MTNMDSNKISNWILMRTTG